MTRTMYSTCTAATRATASVHGVTSHACAQGVSSRRNDSANSTTKATRKRDSRRSCDPNAARSRAGQRRALGEVPANAVGDRIGEALLVARIAQHQFLVGI